ncbi:unnamed protein product [Amoebophrya sp. A25]|nr:unnamed protein product [Amoebophrya sp. A25]|eukprot:GSA25T00004591001.1
MADFIPGSLEELAASPPVLMLSMDYPDMLFKESLVFFYCASIVIGIMESQRVYTFAHLALLSIIRAFGAYGFVLPVMLGQLPNRAFESTDTYFWVLFCASLYGGFFVPHIMPESTHKWFQMFHHFCYSIIRGNSLGHGFSLTVNLVPTSLLAPFFGGFVAVNGHAFLENGLSVADSLKLNCDTVFGVVGGCVYFLLIQYLAVPAGVARVCLVILHVALDHGLSDYLAHMVVAKYDKVAAFIKAKMSKSTQPKAAAMKSVAKRGRSKTPKK